MGGHQPFTSTLRLWERCGCSCSGSGSAANPSPPPPMRRMRCQHARRNVARGNRGGGGRPGKVPAGGPSDAASGGSGPTRHKPIRGQVLVGGVDARHLAVANRLREAVLPPRGTLLDALHGARVRGVNVRHWQRTPRGTPQGVAWLMMAQSPADIGNPDITSGRCVPLQIVPTPLKPGPLHAAHAAPARGRGDGHMASLRRSCNVNPGAHLRLSCTPSSCHRQPPKWLKRAKKIRAMGEGWSSSPKGRLNTPATPQLPQLPDPALFTLHLIPAV